MAYTGPWRTVNSLQALRTQVNTQWPDRSKASDGTIADDAHSSTSDHYPHAVASLGAVPVVTAFDLTHDPGHGVHCGQVAESIRQSRDQRVKYVIWDHRMYSSYRSSSGIEAWTWRPYSGSDPHTNHMHISVLDAPVADSTLPWMIGVDDMPLTPEEYAEIVQGSLTDDNVLHYDLRSILDGDDPSLAGYFAKGWAHHVGLKQLAAGQTELAGGLAELSAKIDALAAPTGGFSEAEIRRFVREEIEDTFVRARYRVDPAV